MFTLCLFSSSDCPHWLSCSMLTNSWSYIPLWLREASLSSIWMRRADSFAKRSIRRGKCFCSARFLTPPRITSRRWALATSSRRTPMKRMSSSGSASWRTMLRGSSTRASTPWQQHLAWWSWIFPGLYCMLPPTYFVGCPSMRICSIRSTVRPKPVSLPGIFQFYFRVHHISLAVLQSAWHDFSSQMRERPKLFCWNALGYCCARPTCSVQNSFGKPCVMFFWPPSKLKDGRNKKAVSTVWWMPFLKWWLRRNLRTRKCRLRTWAPHLPNHRPTRISFEFLMGRMWGQPLFRRKQNEIPCSTWMLWHTFTRSGFLSTDCGGSLPYKEWRTSPSISQMPKWSLGLHEYRLMIQILTMMTQKHNLN